MLRLLIVDDEPIIREALSEMIDYISLGYKLIGTAKNGMEAYDIICDEYPDVVITDIKMPILNGLELIEKAHKTDQHITFILLSGYGEFEYARKAMQFGVKHYLLKPTKKAELIETLKTIYQTTLKQALASQQQQSSVLHKVHIPLQQCFIMEALEYPLQLPSLFQKYQRLEVFSDSSLTACFCFFVEESYLFPSFTQDIHKILKHLGICLSFPILYVKNTAIIIAPLNTLLLQEDFKAAVVKLHYPCQSTSFEASICHCDTMHTLFSEIIHKISRYERILLVTDTEQYELINSLTSPQRLQQLTEQFYSLDTELQREHFLHTLFCEQQDIQRSKTLAVSIFLNTNSTAACSIESACDFFKKLYSCSSISKICELLCAMLSVSRHNVTSKKSNIALLKEYIEEHLDSETLSLKWLAQNYLFVNVGYLSKQFIKEEGMRFSEYLNQKRISEAVRLMSYYQKDNIKYIAQQVGFGNNPQYFSQVFKKYTGSTPSDYLNMLKHPSQNSIHMEPLLHK